MAFTKKPTLPNMIISLIAGLSVAGVAADGAQVSMITKTFSGIGTGLVTVTLPVQPSTASPSTPLCAGPFSTNMGFIGLECHETTQPGALPYVTTSFAVPSTSSVDTLTIPTQAVTTFTTLVSSFISTTTEPPRTITMTVSEIIPSMTVTAMCDWPDENIITPCTTVVLATGLATAAVPTTSKSAAIPSMRNPLVVVMAFTKRAAGNTSKLFKGLTSFISAGAVDNINEGAVEVLSHIQPRQLYHKCLQVPALYTPIFMTIVSILTGVFLFYAFDVNNPRKAGLVTAAYVLTFIFAYVVVIYVEYYNITVGPAWKQCISTTTWYNETLAGGTLSNKA